MAGPESAVEAYSDFFFAPTAPHLKLVRRGLDNGYTAPYEPSEIHIPGHRSHANPGEKAAETAITHLI